MRVLILGAADVARLLPPAEAFAAMEQAFRALAGGRAAVPPRGALVPPGLRGALAWMPAWMDAGPRGPVLGIKAISVFGGANRGGPYPSHQGAVLLFDAEHGQPLAMIDGGAITERRTAATTALATRLLARRAAGTLCLLGSGAQATSHLAALRAERPLAEVRVWSRDPTHACAFAEAKAALHPLPVRAVASARAAVEGADLVCTLTAARAPVLEGAWLAPGTHVNAVGASVPPYRELDTAAVRRARVFVESRAAALAEAEDVRQPLAAGAIGPEHVAGELGDLLEQRVAGRRTDGEITLFKSVGLAVEDVAAAGHVYARALREQVGVWVEFGAERPL